MNLKKFAINSGIILLSTLPVSAMAGNGKQPSDFEKGMIESGIIGAEKLICLSVADRLFEMDSRRDSYFCSTQNGFTAVKCSTTDDGHNGCNFDLQTTNALKQRIDHVVKQAAQPSEDNAGQQIYPVREFGPVDFSSSQYMKSPETGCMKAASSELLDNKSLPGMVCLFHTSRPIVVTCQDDECRYDPKRTEKLYLSLELVLLGHNKTLSY